ncbi:hypothetical protein BKA82DRAFT_4184288 [Pisolithus tinctorius]|nr:hypothetical protein BKA82DRAFT_4184288 [Pisolithus tinctorius]
MGRRGRTIVYNQPRLSEQLQLLNHFGYSDLQVHMPSKGVSQESDDNVHANTPIRLLETIAVALTTGKPGEVFATAFDRRKGLTLVLAKNDIVTVEDHQAVRDLFNVLTAATTKDARDVFPFLFARCRMKIEKRVRKMCEADYEPSPSIEDEFPDSAQYREDKYSGDEPSFPQLMHDLLMDLVTRARGFDSWDANVSAQLYMDLAQIAHVLATNLSWKLLGEKLQRRLAKVCQYYHGINSLIAHAKSDFPRGIVYRWVDASPASAETIVHLCEDYLEAVSRAFRKDLPEETVAMLRERFPDMEESWHSSHVVQTRIHPETRILYDLTEPPRSRDFRQPQPIGCSKRSCLCCTLWIEAYNMTYGTQWLLSSSHGRPCPTWAFPVRALSVIYSTNGRKIVDETVQTKIKECLDRTVDRLFPRQRSLCLCGGESSSDSEIEEWSQFWALGAKRGQRRVLTTPCTPGCKLAEYYGE